MIKGEARNVSHIYTPWHCDVFCVILYLSDSTLRISIVAQFLLYFFRFSAGQSMLMYTVNDGQFQYRANLVLSNSQWIHSSIVFSPGQLVLFSNGRNLAKSAKTKFSLEVAKSATLMIGSLVRLGSFNGPKLLLDELVIWYSQLDALKIRDIVTKNGIFSFFIKYI